MLAVPEALPVPGLSGWRPNSGGLGAPLCLTLTRKIISLLFLPSFFLRYFDRAFMCFYFICLPERWNGRTIPTARSFPLLSGGGSPIFWAHPGSASSRSWSRSTSWETCLKLVHRRGSRVGPGKCKHVAQGSYFCNIILSRGRAPTLVHRCGSRVRSGKYKRVACAHSFRIFVILLNIVKFRFLLK